MNAYSLSIKREIVVCLAACGVIAFSPILSLFVGLVRTVIIFPFKLDAMFVYGIFIFILLLAIKTVVNRSSVLLFGIIILLFIAYLIAFGVNGENIEYFTEYGINFLILSAPWIFITYAVRDFKLFKRYLYIISLIIIVSLIMNMYVFKIDVFGEYTYTQTYAYAMLPAAIIICDSFFKKIQFFNVFLFAVSIVFIIAMGARGPLFCIILYLLLKTIIVYKSKPKKAFLISAVISTICALVYVGFYKILNYLLIIFQEANLSTRILLNLLEGTYLVDSARNSLFNYSIELVREHPLVGVGIGNDRLLLAAKMQNSSVLEAMGWYPHNIFLELLLHFGIIFGGVIILYLLIVLFNSVIK
ncbi:MAG: O-antigen ligase family protein, partial [Clostridiales bacterium]|nr:O-antigen ligase family protein [Clostridiales bacterium]